MHAAVAEGGSAALAVSSVAGAHHVVWANSAALQLLEMTADELINRGLRPDESIRLDDLAHWTVVVSQLVDAEPASAPGCWHAAALDAPDRSLSSIEVMLRGLADGLSVVWLRPTTDGERLAKAAQRESEHRFRALADHAPIGIVVSEAGVRLGFVNNWFAEIAGTATTNLLGTRWLNAICHEDLPTLLEAVEQVLAGAPAEAAVRITPAATPLITSAAQVRWVQIRLSPVVTVRRASGFIGTIEDITQRRAWEAQLAHIAGHDALTGLANRRTLVTAVSEALEGRRVGDRQTAVLFCDLNGFKAINDTLGHEAGDRVLVEVAKRLSATAREHDLVARLAGDEFVVLLRQVESFADADRAARRQADALTAPIQFADRSVTISASIGIAMAANHADATSLLQAADRRMYEAKRAAHGAHGRRSGD